MASNDEDIVAEVWVAPDGRLLASGWHGYMCDHCNNYHIDLLDQKREAFASVMIMEDSFTEFGNKLLSIATARAADRAYNGQKPTNKGGNA